MAKFIRKVDKRTWLTNNDMPFSERLEKGIEQLRDLPDNRPSVYAADKDENRLAAIAAVAWDRRGRKVDLISKTDYVIITGEQVSQAGLELVPEKPTIPWAVLEDKHFVLTRGAAPCGDDDLRRLVTILIEQRAEHGRYSKAVLRDASAKYETQS